MRPSRFYRCDLCSGVAERGVWHVGEDDGWMSVWHDFWCQVAICYALQRSRQMYEGEHGFDIEDKFYEWFCADWWEE